MSLQFVEGERLARVTKEYGVTVAEPYRGVRVLDEGGRAVGHLHTNRGCWWFSPAVDVGDKPLGESVRSVRQDHLAEIAAWVQKEVP